MCKKVRTECAGEKLSVQSGIHWSPKSLRQAGGGEGGAGPSGVLCSSGPVTPSKSRARGLIGDVSSFDSLGFLAIHGAGTHSIEGKKWQENAEHIAQDIWGCSAFMLSKWDSYCRVDLGSPSQNFFRAPPARSAGKPMEHSYRYRLRFGGPIWLPKLPSIFPRDFKNFQAFFHRFFVR